MNTPAASADTLDSEIVSTIEDAQKWIVFDERRHRYTVKGEHYPSVTTIIDGTLSKPALIDWAARMQRDADLAMLRTFSAGDLLDAIEQLESTQADAYRRIKESAGNLGTEVHTLIDRWCNAKVGIPVGMAPTVSDDALWVYEGFERWAEQVDLTPLCLEKRVAHVGLKYAGKFDFLGYAEGQLCVADWKTGKAIYQEYMLQGVTYARTLSEMGLPEPQALIVRLPKQGRSPIEPHWVDGDYDEIFNVFASLLKVYRWRR